MIQTQTARGPLLNDHAEIIGINSFRGEGEGLDCAVAADVVGTLLEGLEGRAAPSAPRAVAPPSPRTDQRHPPNIVGASFLLLGIVLTSACTMPAVIYEPNPAMANPPRHPLRVAVAPFEDMSPPATLGRNWGGS